MTASEHLTNAPITEALIDICLTPKEGLEVEKLAALHDKIVAQYPTKRVRRQFEGQFELREGEAPEPRAVDKGIHRYMFISADEKQVVQFGLDGFTFSRLKPYETWEQLRDEACRLWQLYLAEAIPEFVTRIAVRYINQLTIPLPINDYRDWLTAPPNVPAGMSLEIDSFLSRIVVKDASTDAVAVITQAREQEVAPKEASIILDIDVFKLVQYETASSQIWDELEKLRNFKNKIFFESITEPTKRLYI